nr:MAG TPA: hypothetical protein [Caudoviricetes sp.]
MVFALHSIYTVRDCSIFGVQYHFVYMAIQVL